MHLSENEGIEGNRFVVTGGLGFVGSALCLELVRRGAEEVRTLDTRISSPWSPDLQKSGVRCMRAHPMASELPLKSNGAQEDSAPIRLTVKNKPEVINIDPEGNTPTGPKEPLIIGQGITAV